MLPRGAKHPGGIAVPAIRVGAGGHRPRRTSQLVLIRSAEHARGTTRSVVEGASALRFAPQRRRVDESDAPSTMLPRPRFGEGWSRSPAARGRMT